MNSVHDMGGMHGMGLIVEEKNEPVFHEGWEGRIFAMNLAMGAWRKWNLDASRHSRELIPPAEYLRMSYHEKWIAGLIELMVKAGLVRGDEIESGTPAVGSAKAIPAVNPEQALARITTGLPAKRNVDLPARFKIGQRVRTRNVHALGHTRLPRYARGRFGNINRDHGVFVFPDTNAHFLGEHPQHVYSVCFAARELWGAQAAEKDSVYVDLWDEYLEPA